MKGSESDESMKRVRNASQSSGSIKDVNVVDMSDSNSRSRSRSDNKINTSFLSARNPKL